LKKATVLTVIIAIILLSDNTFTLSGMRQEVGVKIKIEKEWKGNHCGYSKAARLVIKSKDRWKEVWGKMHHLRLSKPELPKIDFQKEMVIAVFMGEHKSGGYEIEIIRVTKTEEEIVVEVEEKQPPPESLRTMALTQPYHIAVIKRSPLRVRFQHALK